LNSVGAPRDTVNEGVNHRPNHEGFDNIYWLKRAFEGDLAVATLVEHLQGVVDVVLGHLRVQLEAKFLELRTESDGHFKGELAKWERGEHRTSPPSIMPLSSKSTASKASRIAASSIDMA
jgi:hypothetical protein